MTKHIDPQGMNGRPCSLAATLEVVGDRWALPAIREVMLGNHRFRQIARNTGAPTDRLAARLKALVESGVLERRPLPDDARHQGYYLTEAGRDLAGITRELIGWGDRWAVTTPPFASSTGTTHSPPTRSARPVASRFTPRTSTGRS